MQEYIDIYSTNDEYTCSWDCWDEYPGGFGGKKDKPQQYSITNLLETIVTRVTTATIMRLLVKDLVNSLFVINFSVLFKQVNIQDHIEYYTKENYDVSVVFKQSQFAHTVKNFFNKSYGCIEECTSIQFFIYPNQEIDYVISKYYWRFFWSYCQQW